MGGADDVSGSLLQNSLREEMHYTSVAVLHLLSARRVLQPLVRSSSWFAIGRARSL